MACIPYQIPRSRVGANQLSRLPKLHASPPLQLRRRSLARGLIPMAAQNVEKEQAERATGVLFVCLGNICRSPAAEAIFRRCVEKRGLESSFTIDSAGTIGYHEGNPADSRMREAAKRRALNITSISRRIRPRDFEQFEHILAMDKSNKADILKAYQAWSKQGALAPIPDDKVRLMCDFCNKHTLDEVPDPYYGGPAGFEKVLDLLEDACEGFLDSVVGHRDNSSVAS